MTPREVQVLIDFAAYVIGYPPYRLCLHQDHITSLKGYFGVPPAGLLSVSNTNIASSNLDMGDFYHYNTQDAFNSGTYGKVYSIAGAISVMMNISSYQPSVTATPGTLSVPGQNLPPGTGAFQGRSLKIPLDYNADSNISGIDYAKQTCSHTWQQYNGLRESYQFCTKCDEKRTTEEGEAEENKFKEMYDTINNIWRPS